MDAKEQGHRAPILPPTLKSLQGSHLTEDVELLWQDALLSSEALEPVVAIWRWGLTLMLAVDDGAEEPSGGSGFKGGGLWVSRSLRSSSESDPPFELLIAEQQLQLQRGRCNFSGKKDTFHNRRWFVDDEEGGGGVTYGSMLTGVASLIADSTGGVMSQLSVRETENSFCLIDHTLGH